MNTVQTKLNTPLTCSLDGDCLVVRIGINTLAFAAANCEHFWDGESDADTPTIKVTDPAVFAKEVCRYLNEEEEDGTTLVNAMIENGIIRAVEFGCEGVDHEA